MKSRRCCQLTLRQHWDSWLNHLLPSMILELKGQKKVRNSSQKNRKTRQQRNHRNLIQCQPQSLLQNLWLSYLNFSRKQRQPHQSQLSQLTPPLLRRSQLKDCIFSSLTDIKIMLFQRHLMHPLMNHSPDQKNRIS